MVSMGEFSKKKGFTLVEILIVVMIVGLLSSIAIGSYTHYRKASLLELAADNIISSLYGARDNVKFGKDLPASGGSIGSTGSAGSAKCEGVRFSDQDGGQGPGYVKRVSTEFSSKKKWVDGGWQITGCASDVEEKLIELDDLVSVEKILLDGVEISECEIFFAPPDGDVVFRESGGGGGDSLEVVVKYGEGADDSYRKIIGIDLKNAIANVKKDLGK